jgi:tripartite-type tricarboxylate transporter receptor subunit TctC
VVALAKAKPGTLNYGSSGLGAPLHLLAEMFKFGAGSLDIAHIPYRGDAPMLTALLSGDVHIGFMPAGTGVRQVQQGQVRGLAVTGQKRSPALPEVPTLLEAGVKGLEADSWYGLFAPAGTPRDIVLRLNREMVEVVKLPDVVERLRANGNEPVGGTPEQLDALYRADIARFAKVIADAKIPKLD